MGPEIPAEVRWLSWIVEPDWPEGDETAMRRCAEAWRAAAAGVNELIPDLQGDAAGVLRSVQGAAADEFERHWKTFVTADPRHLPRLVERCERLAGQLDRGARDVEYAKYLFVALLIGTATDIAELTARSAAGAPGAAAAGIPAIEAAARVTSHAIFQHLLTAVTRGAVVSLLQTAGFDVLLRAIQVAGGAPAPSPLPAQDPPAAPGGGSGTELAHADGADGADGSDGADDGGDAAGRPGDDGDRRDDASPPPAVFFAQAMGGPRRSARRSRGGGRAGAARPAPGMRLELADRRADDAAHDADQLDVRGPAEVIGVGARRPGPPPGPGPAYGMGEPTPAGRSLYGPDEAGMRELARRVRPDPGRYVVDGHGTRTGMRLGDRDLSARDVAGIIRADPAWAGRDVVLLTWNATPGDGAAIAVALARELGVPVVAPVLPVWTDNRGRVLFAAAAGAAEPGHGVAAGRGDVPSWHGPTWPPGRGWRTLHPDSVPAPPGPDAVVDDARDGDDVAMAAAGRAPR
ncbi:MAG TPA: hypothetical protein VF069_22860 [Streptosporangiaceae bacterium]